MRRLGLALTSLLGVGALATAAPSGTSAGPSPSLQQLLDGAGGDGLPFDPLLATVSCPVERGPVKEGADADRFKVSATVAGTSLYYLVTRPKPSAYPRNNRIAPYELRTWQLNATLVQFKQESDGDVHLVLKDSTGRVMIAEIPYLGCVPASSRWRTAIAGARSTMTHAYTVSTSWRYVRRSVTVRGLGMFDPPHGQTGAARNGIELHPVIGIAFH